MKKRYLMLGFSLIILSFIAAFQTHAADWQRTVVLMFGQTQTGQDMFIRGGIDHSFALNNLGRNCTAENKLCAIPIQHLNNRNTTTNPWKISDNFLDWYGTEINQSTQSQGTPMDWTTNLWPSSWGAKKTVAIDGFGETPLNSWGHHYWMMEVMMDCSATVNGWFELKSFISNGPGWEPNVAQTGTPYSSGNHFAKCGKINKFERGSNAALIQDFPDTTPTANKFFIQVDMANDYVFLHVNGVERMRWAMTPNERNSQSNPIVARVGEKIDITHLLAKGDNDIRLVSTSNNEGRFGGYDIKLWADTNLIMNKQGQKFITTNFKPILLDQKLKINLLNGTIVRKLFVTKSNSSEAAIYINNVFTGKYAPASFDLPEGEYRLGVGESIAETDQSNDTLFLSVKFREQDIVITNQDLMIDSASLPILQNNNVLKTAVIPLTHVHHGLTNAEADLGLSATPNKIGVMTADDITVAEKSLNVTNEKWFKPMTYNQSSWQVTMLPPVTERVYRTDHLRWHVSQYGTDLSTYDMVVLAIANSTAPDANNQRQIIDIPGAASGKIAWMPQTWLDGNGTTLTERIANVRPSPGLLHEVLHVYESYTRNDYNGAAGLHGDDAHGYKINDCELHSDQAVCWYKDYARSQAAEDTTTTHEVLAFTKPTAATASQFAGLFNVLHSGFSAKQQWSFSKPTSRIQNTAHSSCIDVSGADLQDNVAIIGWPCHTNNNQRWSLKHIHNGAYQIVNENSQKCGEIVAGQLLQKTCNTNLAQRFLIVTNAANEFNIKSLSGQCLTLPAFTANITSATCNTGQFNQLWKMN